MKTTLGKEKKLQSILKKTIQQGLPLVGLVAVFPLTAWGEPKDVKTLPASVDAASETSQFTGPIRGDIARVEPVKNAKKTENSSRESKLDSLPVGFMKPSDSSAPVALPAQTESYTVKSGDTLIQIARQRGVSIEILKKLNKFSDSQANKIKVGQKILVPKIINQKNETDLKNMPIGKIRIQDKGQ